MGKARSADGLIVLDDIEDDAVLRGRLVALTAVDSIDLLVGGVRGYWEPVVIQRGGRPVAAIRPVETMRRTAAGQTVEIELPPRDDGLATFGMRLQYWDTQDNQIH
jgi:hypothetical protein